MGKPDAASFDEATLIAPPLQSGPKPSGRAPAAESDAGITPASPVASPDIINTISRRLRRVKKRRFSPLTRRILVLNMLPLAMLIGGVFFLDQYEQELLESEISALRVQAEIVAAGLGEGATRGLSATNQRLDPELSREMVVRLVQPTGVRARLFMSTNELVADSLNLPGLGLQRIEVTELPPPHGWSPADWIDGIGDWFDSILAYRRRSYPAYSESAVQLARDYEEVVIALRGGAASAIRTDRRDRRILSVAVPVQRYKEVLGALMLSHDDATVAASLRQVRLDILKVSLVALIATVLLSLYLAGTIARPIRLLAAAAQRVRSSDGGEPTIPDLSERRDEIGDLSLALHEMTNTLWKRMGAIESFAADVAHELKNPLTSLRSAVETAARIENPEQRTKLMAIVLDDVNRLNRLISDISRASRLDAELMRADLTPIDLADLLQNMLGIYRGQALEQKVAVELITQGKPPFQVRGHEGRYSQVFANLIENALSFSPPDAKVTVTLAHDGGLVIVAVEDNGPGIPDNKLGAIFDRFYSERPAAEQFGKHSGLGLSIAKQIVETYEGSIVVANRRNTGGKVLGARFTVTLPVA
ncbi:MAG: stimulus-sensing domain-containing protein [Rhodospirillales bacterium]